MCGIAGIVDLRAVPDRVLLERMCRVMTHRGPDGEGYYIDGPVGLGHRRLSIIDLEGGAQPMSNEDGSLWITYNGEIYNFMDLRKELIEKGHRFKTRSDTETIIHAYEEYGFKCLDRFRGMFAFALWDGRKRMLFAARDRIGKKPFYYYCDKTKFIFSSEVKALLQDRSMQRSLNPDAICDYLTYHYVPFPETIFQDIYKLPPGHYVTVRIVEDVRGKEVQDVRIDLSDKNEDVQFDSNKRSDRTVRTNGAIEHLELSIHQYWDVKYNPDYSLTEDDWAEALREKLKEAVRMRLISDVPLGAFLSGGIDSSTVVALMAMDQDKPVKTFSIGFKEEDFSEVQYAREIAERFGTEHHEMVVDPDAIEILPRLAWEFDEPFADASAIPTYYVSQMAREKVTVILSGDGGDETFAGYRRYLWANDMRKYDRLPPILKEIIFGIPAKALPEGVKGKGMLTHLSRSPFARYAGLNTFYDRHYVEGILTKDILEAAQQGVNGNRGPYSFMKQYYENCNTDDYLSKIQYIDTKTYLAEDILTKVDRASMLCSLETRAPLLDHEVIELSARIPSSLKIRNGQTKYILKKALAGILPEKILHREKMGFGVPLVHWFKKDLTQYAREILLSKDTQERGILNQSHMREMIDNHQKKGRDLSARIWALLFFEHWCRNWL